MTKERELIRDLVTLVEGVINPGILRRFEGETSALVNAKQYLAAPSSTDNPVLERLAQAEVRIEDLNKRLHQDYETADAVFIRLKAQIDALDERMKAREGSIEWLTRDSGSMNDRLARIEAKFQDLMERQSDDHQFIHKVKENLGARLADLEWAIDPRSAKWLAHQEKESGKAGKFSP